MTVMAGIRMSLLDCRNRRVQINHLAAVLYCRVSSTNEQIFLKGFHGPAVMESFNRRAVR